MPIPLVLASASPARLATLRRAGIEPRVEVSSVDEEAVIAALVRDAARLGREDPTPIEEALLLARAKAEDVASHAKGALILGCDSVLELDGFSFGKPGTPEVATSRWKKMRGRDGTLHTGHWLIDARESAQDGKAAPSVGEVASTVVRFCRLSDAEIDAYVATGEPLSVAGGFTVDGLGGPFVAGIDGDHHNVVGLSLPLLRHLLGMMNLTIPDLWRASGADDGFVEPPQPTGA